MPRLDGTGPDGTGPFGRGLGPCGAGDFKNRRRFLGFGHGRFAGFGRGGYGYRAFSIQQGEDINDLRAEKSWLERRLDELNQLIDQRNEM